MCPSACASLSYCLYLLSPWSSCYSSLFSSPSPSSWKIPVCKHHHWLFLAQCKYSFLWLTIILMAWFFLYTVTNGTGIYVYKWSNSTYIVYVWWVLIHGTPVSPLGFLELMRTRLACCISVNHDWLKGALFVNHLGGGFKDFLFSPLLGEMIQFD